MNYSDSTPDVTHTYDRRGRQTSVAQAGGTTIKRTLGEAGQLLAESYSGGPLAGISVTNGYDARLRRTNVVVLRNGSPLASGVYAYDAASRLQGVSTGGNRATYSYVANSPWVGQIGFTNNGTGRMTTTKQYDFLNRLGSIASVGTGSTPSPISFAYQYNNANQRVRATLADGSFWLYEYDAMGQVKSGKKYWSDWTPVAGQQVEYAHDDIGNRTQTLSGGNENGANLRTNLYSVNLLNQYESRTVPRRVDVMGVAFANQGRVWRTTASCAVCLKPPAAKAKSPTPSSSTSSPKTPPKPRPHSIVTRLSRHALVLTCDAEPRPLIYPLNCYVRARIIEEGGIYINYGSNTVHRDELYYW